MILVSLTLILQIFVCPFPLVMLFNNLSLSLSFFLSFFLSLSISLLSLSRLNVEQNKNQITLNETNDLKRQNLDFNKCNEPQFIEECWWSFRVLFQSSILDLSFSENSFAEDDEWAVKNEQTLAQIF